MGNLFIAGRLWLWKDAAEEKLKKTWWLWPVGFAIDLFWHRTCGAANEYLDAHGPKIIASIVSKIPADPVSLAVITAIFLVMVLICHAYYETRHSSAFPNRARLRPAEQAAPVTAIRAEPSLRIDYVGGGNGPKLIFRTRNKPLKVQRVGELVCQASYSSKYDFQLLAQVFPEIERGCPWECGVSGIRDQNTNSSASLENHLESVGALTTSCVSVEYEVDGQNRLDRFSIHKNADGSIVLVSGGGEPQAQSLIELNHRLALLTSAPKDLPSAGIWLFLAQESLYIAKQLADILAENEISDAKMDLKVPMALTNIAMQGGKDEFQAFAWQRRRIMMLARRYQWLRDRCQTHGIPSPPGIPTDMESDALLLALRLHAANLETMGNDAIDRYKHLRQQASAQTV